MHRTTRRLSNASRLLIGVLLGAAMPAAASASIYTDDLARCLASSATPSDRQAFLRWMFAMMAANPRIKDMAKITDAESEGLNRQAAQLFQRLMLNDCRQQSLNAIKYDGPSSIVSASETLGRIAMGDLMAAPETSAYMGRMDSYLDKEKWEAFGKEAGRPMPAPAKK